MRAAEIAKARAADERIAAKWDEYHEANAPVSSIAARIGEARKYIARYGARNPARAEEYTQRIVTLEAERDALLPGVRAARQAAIDLDAELYEGWNRFFLVQHIHSSQHCSSFRPTTRIGWLPSVSGLTEAEAVAEHGASLCTICFPTAPVELTRERLDPSLCAGSGESFDPEQPNRARQYYSPWATCPVCGAHVGLKSRGSNAIRKHKADPDAEERIAAMARDANSGLAPRDSVSYGR